MSRRISFSVLLLCVMTLIVKVETKASQEGEQEFTVMK